MTDSILEEKLREFGGLVRRPVVAISSGMPHVAKIVLRTSMRLVALVLCMIRISSHFE